MSANNYANAPAIPPYLWCHPRRLWRCYAGVGRSFHRDHLRCERGHPQRFRYSHCNGYGDCYRHSICHRFRYA